VQHQGAAANGSGPAGTDSYLNFELALATNLRKEIRRLFDFCELPFLGESDIAAWRKLSGIRTIT
jgi:hypothetical protein